MADNLEDFKAGLDEILSIQSSPDSLQEKTLDMLALIARQMVDMNFNLRMMESELSSMSGDLSQMAG